MNRAFLPFPRAAGITSTTTAGAFSTLSALSVLAGDCLSDPSKASMASGEPAPTPALAGARPRTAGTSVLLGRGVASSAPGESVLVAWTRGDPYCCMHRHRPTRSHVNIDVCTGITRPTGTTGISRSDGDHKAGITRPRW